MELFLSYISELSGETVQLGPSSLPSVLNLVSLLLSSHSLDLILSLAIKCM